MKTLVSLDAQGPKGERLDLFHFIPWDLRAQDHGDHPGRETGLPAPGVPMPNDIFATVSESANGQRTSRN